MAKHSSSSGRLISHGHSLYDKFGGGGRGSSSSRALAQVPQLPLFLLLMIALWAAVGCGYVALRWSRSSRPQLPGYLLEPVLISYSYFEKDAIQVRTENVGMDLGGHNVTLEWLSYQGQLARYRYFIFLNSSVKGPFLPAWTPPEWHWTAAYLSAFQPEPSSAAGGGGADPRAGAFPGYSQGGYLAGNSGAPPVHAVSSSLVCLPSDDAGGPGPRLESWAFALDEAGLSAAIEGGVFVMRGCKLCKDADSGVVVGGEYGITTSMFKAGYNIATLLSRYARGIDWSDPQHWSCNDNVHPSRAGLYDGISVHPYETVFVKASWHVAEPYTRRYSQWQLQHLLGKSGTEGTYNQRLYRYGISRAAENPRDLEEAYRPRVQ